MSAPEECDAKLAIIAASTPPDMKAFIDSMRETFGAKTSMIEAGGVRIETREFKEFYSRAKTAVQVSPVHLPQKAAKAKAVSKRERVQQATKYRRQQ